MQIYQANLAGRSIRYCFHYPNTARRFRSWLHPVEGDEYDVMVSDEDILRAYPDLLTGSYEDRAEYKSLIRPTSLFLLRTDCCIFHSVAFLWRDRAWLLTAPSGTGKSTQFLNWRNQFPSEIIMICGDMPILERRENDSIWVHPTSWTGKENIGSFTAAPLGGVVLLEQGKENLISPMQPREAIPPLFDQFCVYPETEAQIRSLCGILDLMLRNYPVWKFVNLGDAASTELLRKTLMQKSGGEDGTI